MLTSLEVLLDSALGNADLLFSELAEISLWPFDAKSLKLLLWGAWDFTLSGRVSNTAGSTEGFAVIFSKVVSEFELLRDIVCVGIVRISSDQMLRDLLVGGISTDRILAELLQGRISSEQILRDLLVRGLSDLVLSEKYSDSTWRLFPLSVFRFDEVLLILMFGEVFPNVIFGALFPTGVNADLGIFRL